MLWKLGFREYESYYLILTNGRLSSEISDFVDKKFGKIEIKLH